MPAIEIPYHVRLQDPPVVPPEYGDEDAPAREAMTFVEYLTHVAQTFRELGNDGNDYIAGLIEAKARLCEAHGIETARGLVDLDRRTTEEDHRHLMAALQTDPAGI